MKITEAKTEAYTWELDPFQATGDIPPRSKEKVPGVVWMVRILTDEGIEGNCIAIQSRLGAWALPESMALMEDVLMGEDPLNREKIWQKLMRFERHRGFPVQAIGAVDVALWDIGGKAANLPIYKLLGAYQDKAPVYAASLFHPTVEDYVKEALECRAKGYIAYKIHPFGEPQKDIEIARAVREAVGDKMHLMLNGCGAYDHIGALKVGRVLDELNFYWFQNPLRDFDIRGYAELARVLDIPIAGTERISSLTNIVGEYILQKGVDIVRSDVSIGGGITGVKKMAILAESFGLKLEIHTALNPLMCVANLHVLCSIKNSDFHQILLPENQPSCAVEPWEYIDEEGNIRAPQKPGLGLEIDWDYIRSHPA